MFWDCKSINFIWELRCLWTPLRLPPLEIWQIAPFALKVSIRIQIQIHWATSSLLLVWVCLHSNFRGGLRKKHVFWNRVHNDHSRSSKVVDLGTNRKHVCDLLLVINSNLGPILPHFRDTTGFPRRATPSLFHQNFRGVPLGLDCQCCGSEERRS